MMHEIQTRKESKLQQENDDSWEWEDEVTLVRKHRTPRRQRFSPQECDVCPCDIERLADKRQTSQIFRDHTMKVEDNWRMKGDYSKNTTNKKNEFWTGMTTFKVMKRDSIGMRKLQSDGTKHVTLCTGCKGMGVLIQENVFIVHRIRAETMPMVGEYPTLQITLLTRSRSEIVYTFHRSLEDQSMSIFGGTDMRLTLAELPKDIPALVLLCSEERKQPPKIQVSCSAHH